MNPYYQYAIRKGYSNADAAISLASKPVSMATEEQIVKQGIVSVYDSSAQSQPVSNDPVNTLVRTTATQPASYSKPVSNTGTPLSQPVSNLFQAQENHLANLFQAQEALLHNLLNLFSLHNLYQIQAHHLLIL